MEIMTGGDDGSPSVETACKKLDASLGSLNSIHAAGANLAKSGTKLAKSGNISDLRKLLTAFDENATAYALGLSGLRSLVALPFGDYLASTRYCREIVAAATLLGLERVSTAERRIYSPPVVASILPDDLAVTVGKKRHKTVRPSAVAALLKQARANLQKTSNESSLEAILRAYLLANGGQLGSARTIDELYAILTILPSARRDYTIDDFMAAVVAIDDEGPKKTKQDLYIRFHGDTLSKGGKGHRMTRASGLQKLYGGISFAKDSGL